MKMQYTRLGATGLRVSRLCLGCMTYGDPGRGSHPWTLPEAEARGFIRQALEAGINFFDTANVYSLGSSEEILGAALGEMARREEVVIATKVHGRMREDANGAGLSRKAILHEIDASLNRLRTDYVDLYQIHRFDPEVPIEETLEALDTVVRAGKARYVGASSMPAWRFATMREVSARHGWARFVSMQNHYNLLYREEEREMLPLCREAGVGVIPWSPLARGRLARPPGEAGTARAGSDAFGSTLYRDAEEADRAIQEAVGRVAEARGASRASVALAWVLAQPGVSAPIVGASKPGHLEDAVAALDLVLSAEELAALGAPYRPRAVAGF
jgi:1-deoxyxylulose-5-phosphate synthase